jgi:3',5'-cyclic AMP phosphodiesterase CpdA
MATASSLPRFEEFNLDPALAEEVEAAPEEKIIEGIVRLEDPDQIPLQFTVVSRFKRICTGRFAATDAWTIRRHPNVVSLKAARPLGIHEREIRADLGLPKATGTPDNSFETFTGRGCIVAALDFGLDFAHPSFLNPDGTTRLVGFWNQGAPYDLAHPNRFGYGRIYSQKEINAALLVSDPYQALGYHPAISDTGSGSHGTLTLDIAAGNGRAPDGTRIGESQQRGISDNQATERVVFSDHLNLGPGAAPGAALIFVHLSTPRLSAVGDLGDSVRVLEALDYVQMTARGWPWVVNLSVGRTAGCHDGTSLVEQGMHELLRLGPDRAICQSAGNYRCAHLAVDGWLRDGEYRDLEWIIDPADTTANQIDAWYSGRDRLVVGIRPPQGSEFVEVKLGQVADLVQEGTVIGRIYHRENDPNNRDNHIEAFLYRGAPPGTWTLRLSGDYVISGRFHAWIERDLARPGAQSRFDAKITSQSYTLGTIATSPLVITVGAYDANADGCSLAPFSSCGPTRDERRDKPELLAPGVGVVGARSIPRGAVRQEGLLVARSGTSFAAPHVARAVAAMLEAAARPVSIEEIRDCLERSAEWMADAEHPNCCAWGRLNAAEAIRRIRDLTESDRVSAPPGKSFARDAPEMASAISNAAPGDFSGALLEQETEASVDERVVRHMEQIESHGDKRPGSFENKSLSAAQAGSDAEVIKVAPGSEEYKSDRVKAVETEPSSSPEKRWGQTIIERWSDEGAVQEEREQEESEYPDTDIISAVREASHDSEGTEETGTEQLASPTPGAAARVRILWPALGFPAVIAPREQNARGNVADDATRSITLLVLSNRTLTREDVARHLRCVTWDNRWQRHIIPEGGSPGTFLAADIAVRADVKSDPISLSTPDNRLTSLVGFGGGKGEKSAIIGGIARAVLTFYREKLPKEERLPYLHEIRISEDASNRLADGQYQLFWNNAKATQDAPSDEMQTLIDYHAFPLRQRTVNVETYEQVGKYLLNEYEFEYGVMHQPYQRSYSQLEMRRPRAEVLHPLFVKREQAEPLRIGHLTDLHVDVRADVYEANLEAAMKFVPKAEYLALFNKAWETLRQKLVAEKRLPTPWRTKADLEDLARLSGLTRELVLSIAATQKLTRYWRKGSYNNLNRSFRDNYTKAKGESDILLLTGDLIDYGRGHYGVTERGRLGENTAYHEDRNWFLFYWLLAGENSYTVPSYTILGNHDWRINPYPPFAIAGAPDVESILNNYEEMIPEFRKWLLQIAHGPGHERAFSYGLTAVGPIDLVDEDPAAAWATLGRLAINTGRLNIAGAPTETTVASVMWYLLSINPFLDYAFPHPSGQKLLMLDWAEAEDVLFDIVERGKARPYLPWEAARAAGPGPKAGDCLTKAQQKMMVAFLAQPGVSKLVGIHAPPIAAWYDWFDSELVESKKVFPRFSTIRTKEDCEKIGEKWEEDDKRCIAKRVPRGPDMVSKLANGEEKHWHPFFAIRPSPRAFDGMVADYGSLVERRDWFITQLIEPKYGVRAVFSGHNHRDGLHTLWRMGPESGPETDGSLRVRLIPGRVRSVKPGSILGPLWVNTTTAGFRGHYRPSPGQDHYVPPGRALVSMRSDGTIDVAEFRRLPGIDKRVAVPAASSPSAPAMTSEAAISGAVTEDSLEEVLVNSGSADEFPDRAERALPSSYSGRRESETAFLRRLLGELGCHVSASGLSPAELARAFLYDGPLKHNAQDVLEILAMPSQQPEGALRQGDWMLRGLPGAGHVGHVAVLASDDLMEQPMLARKGVAAESVQPGHYGLVIEAGAYPHSRSQPFARRWLDSRGRVPPHTVLLRPKYSESEMAALGEDNPPDSDQRPTELSDYQIKGGLYSAKQKIFHAQDRRGLILTASVVCKWEEKLALRGPSTVVISKEMTRFEGNRLGEFVENFNEFTHYFDEVLRAIGRLRDLLSAGAPEAPTDMTPAQKFALRPTDDRQITGEKKRAYRDWREAQARYAAADGVHSLVFEVPRTGRQFDDARQTFWEAQGTLSRTIAQAKRDGKPKFKEIELKFSDLVSVALGVTGEDWKLVVLVADKVREALKNKAEYEAKLKEFSLLVKNIKGAIQDQFEAFRRAGATYWTEFEIHRETIAERDKARIEARRRAADFGQAIAPHAESRLHVLAAIRMPALVSDAWRALAIVGPPALAKLTSALASRGLIDRATFHYQKSKPDPFGVEDITNIIGALKRAESWKIVLTKNDVDEWVAMNNLWEETFNKFDV